MNNLQETRLFALLSEPSQTLELANEVNDAYRDFKTHLIEVCNSNDNTVVYRSLNEARVEFTSLNSINQYGQGEKCAN